MNIIKFFFSRPAVKFSFFKYIEILVTAVTTFFVAEKVGPKEMGKAIPILLYVTYANYLSLGLNQVVVKNYNRIKDSEKINFITINLQYILLVCIFNFLLAYILLPDKFFILTSLISSGTIFRSFMMSYFRAVYKIHILNKNNLIFSVGLLLLVFFFTESWYEYMFYWALCIVGCVILYFNDDVSFFKKIFVNILNIPTRSSLKYNFYQGIKLAAIGALSTFFLTTDRFVIDKMDIGLELKGAYQLADYGGTAIYMVATTVMFYFYPKWIEKIRENKDGFLDKNLKFLKIGLLSSVPLLILVYFGVKIIKLIVFKDYLYLEEFVVANTLLKWMIVMLSAISTIYIGLDREKEYIKSMIPLMIAYLMIILISIYFIKNIQIVYIPVVFSVLILIDISLKIFFLKKIQN